MTLIRPSAKSLLRVRRLVRRSVPAGARRFAHTVRYRLLDAMDTLLGRHDDLTPPHKLIFVGRGNYRKIGQEFFQYFKDLGGLQPHYRVLDIGSGIGRMAVPMIGYLSDRGSYEGFDVVPLGVEWCTEHITRRDSHFQFRVADVRNKEYNPGGRVTAAEYRFPYPDESFDFAFLTSVFTHMLPDEVENYLREIQRVLKPGGRSLITWFLLNPESEALIREGASSLDFVHALGECLTTNPETPEEAICYRQSHVIELYERAGLEIEPPIRYGSWCGRKRYLSYQDLCVARKQAPGLGLAS